MNATSTTGRATLVAANGRARRPAEPPQGDLSHAEALRGRERRDLWFGEVPDGWEVKRLASYFSERKVKVSDKDFPPLSVTKNGILPQLENVAKTDDGDNRKLVRKGDFVINSRSDRKGSSGLSEYDGSVSLINLVLKPRGGLFGAYCNYLLKSLSFVEENYRNGRGIVADLWTTRYDEMKMIKVAMPPLPKQKAIVAYLDAETGRIDKAIAAEEKMIALLQERREIVINEAMGGGDFSRKDRKERKGWEASTIRRHFDITLGKMLCSNKLSDDYTLEKYFCAADVHFGDLATTDNKQMWFSHKEKDQYLIKNGDLLIVEGGAGAGGACVVQGLKENFYIQNSILRLRSRGTASERFVCYVLEGFVKRGYIEMACNKATIPHFTKEKVGDVPIPLPPLSEQEAIVERLDRETGKIDRAIEVKRRQIELLRERRQIVIDEVVTGKVKVA